MKFNIMKIVAMLGLLTLPTCAPAAQIPAIQNGWTGDVIRVSWNDAFGRIETNSINITNRLPLTGGQLTGGIAIKKNGVSVVDLYSNANYNAFIGYNAGISNSGTYNTGLGSHAGRNSTGNNQMFLGNFTGIGATNSNYLYIDNWPSLNVAPNTDASLTNSLFVFDGLTGTLWFGRPNGNIYMRGNVNFPLGVLRTYDGAGVAITTNINVSFQKWYDVQAPNCTITLPSSSLSSDVGKIITIRTLYSSAIVLNNDVISRKVQGMSSVNDPTYGNYMRAGCVYTFVYNGMISAGGWWLLNISYNNTTDMLIPRPTTNDAYKVLSTDGTNVFWDYPRYAP